MQFIEATSTEPNFHGRKHQGKIWIILKLEHSTSKSCPDYKGPSI